MKKLLLIAVCLTTLACAEISWTDETLEDGAGFPPPKQVSLWKSSVRIHQLGPSVIAGHRMYVLGISLRPAAIYPPAEAAEIVSMTIVVQTADGAKTTYLRTDVQVKDYKSEDGKIGAPVLRRASAEIAMLDQPIIAVLAIDTTEKRIETGKERTLGSHRFR
jgi:hypothetical protein